MKHYLKVEKLEYGEWGMRVHLNSCDEFGKRDYNGYTVISVASLDDYKPGQVFALALTEIVIKEAVAA
jgi:hypothetical protein